MNIWQNDFMVESHRQRIVEEIEEIHLEQLALKARVYRPGLFARTMYNFANWMIATGKQLRKRYEVPCVHHNHVPTGSFAK